jgi:hypothetical protein
MTIRQVGDELFHADGRTDRQTDKQTDMTKLTFAFRIFGNALKNEISFLHLTFAFDKVINFFFRQQKSCKSL